MQEQGPIFGALGNNFGDMLDAFRILDGGHLIKSEPQGASFATFFLSTIEHPSGNRPLIFDRPSSCILQISGEPGVAAIVVSNY
jgi:hypothetical protein